MTISQEEKNNDKYFWKGFNSNFGRWLTIGGINPKGPKWIPPLFLIVLLFCEYCLVSTCCSTFYSHLDIFCENVHFIVFSSVTAGFGFSYNLQKKTIYNIYSAVGRSFHDYEETLDDETKREVLRLRESSRKRKLFLMKLLTVCSAATYLLMNILRPFLKYFSNEHLLETPDQGMFRLLPVTFRLPLEVSVQMYVLLFTVVEAASVVALGLFVGHNIFFLAICEDCSTELTVIGLTIRRARARASLLHISRESAIRKCLSHSVRHHQFINSLVKDIENIVYFPALLYMLLSALLLCFGGFLFISDRVPLTTKASFAFFMVSELGGISVYCYYGEKINTTSCDIYNEVYYGDWIEDMKIMKSYNLLIQTRTLEGLQISAGGFMYLTLETYRNVLSSAFSYFNLLLALSN